MTIEPTDRLCIAHRKRLSHGYVTSETGARELCIYYGTKEVSFDDERLFAFGEQLVTQAAFTAQAATRWGPGYDWAEVRDMLEALVGEGIIVRADAVDEPRGGGLVPSLLPPATCRAPRMWSAAECESITSDLVGRPIEIGNLEAVVAAYRIPHAARDDDGRQVGEANVFPPGLRLDCETEWRVCQYTGSRYRDDAPMNVTALKAMIKHWKPMMRATSAIRSEVLRRLPRSHAGWMVGDLHTYARVVLAVPAYALMLRGGASPQLPLHPVLSSLFRITDGIRMTTHDMLFLSAERTRRPDEPIDAAELFGFAERNGMFISQFGVCAGPKAMMDEFFSVVFDGAPVAAAESIELAPAVQALLSPPQLTCAVDYALLGLQVWAVARSTWIAMRDAVGALRTILADASGAEPWRARLEADWAELARERLADEAECDVHRAVYADAYEQAWRGLPSPLGSPRLADRVAARPEDAAHAAAQAELRGALTRRLGATAGRIAEVLVGYLRVEQAVLTALAELQGAINALLERPRPTRSLRVRDLAAVFAMHPPPISRFPYLLDTLDDELGIRVDCTADAIAISDRRA